MLERVFGQFEDVPVSYTDIKVWKFNCHCASCLTTQFYITLIVAIGDVTLFVMRPLLMHGDFFNIEQYVVLLRMRSLCWCCFFILRFYQFRVLQWRLLYH